MMMALTGSTGWFGAFAGALFGGILGSFAGMASWRWPRDENWVTPSHCTRCGHRLTAMELIPVLSWLWQRGKSACCGQPLSARYPTIELVVGGLAAVAGWHYGLSLDFALLAVLLCTLVFLSAVDLDCGLVPDGANLTVALTGVGWIALHEPVSWWEPLLSVAQTGGVGVLLAWGYSRLRGRDMLGWGDVKLMAASGLWLRPDLAPAYLFIGAAVGVLSGLIWKRAGLGEEFPFAPALAIALVALVSFQALA